MEQPRKKCSVSRCFSVIGCSAAFDTFPHFDYNIHRLTYRSNRTALLQAELLLEIVESVQSQSIKARAGTSTRYISRWTQEPVSSGFYRIPYEFHKRLLGNPVLIKGILRTLKLFNSATCLRFEPAQPNDKNTMKFLFGSCATYLGRNNPPFNELFVGLDDCFSVGKISRVLMFSLGMYYEIGRSDRDKYVKFVAGTYGTNGYRNFQQLFSYVWESYNSPYDFKSIMHFDGYEFSTRGSATIRVKSTDKPVQAQSIGPSIEDLKQIRAMYGCTKRGLNETTTCYHTSDHGYSYRGRVNTTIGNLTCQRWNSSFPNNHYFSPSDITAAGLEDNYCRNPDMSDMPWCYVTNSNKIWEYCNITACPPNAEVPILPTPTPPQNIIGFWLPWSSWKPCSNCDRGFTYRTRSCVGNTPGSLGCPGIQWQSEPCYEDCPIRERQWSPWGAWSACDKSCGPGTHSRVRYCPEGGCKGEVLNSGSCEAQACPLYSDGGCFKVSEPGSYRGNRNVTTSGEPCKHWNQTSYRNNTNFPNLNNNYCRNPNRSSVPWCFSALTNRSETCNVSICNTAATWSDWAPWSACSKSCGGGLQFKSKYCVAGTWGQGNCKGPFLSARQCNGHICDYSGGPPPLPLNFIPNLSFVNDTGCVDPKKPQTYRGIARTTVSGKTCQFWMSQYPNKIAYPGALKVRLQGLRENYCRSTSSNMWPGCYPASFGDKWEPCAIPLCSLGAARIEEPDCYYARDRMSYLGTVNVTRKGVACQRWDTFTPHMHKYIVPLYRYLGAHNYCRNPDLDARGPWCFTMDHHRRKDYCKVPRC
uniref:apolipoprotein(a)-like isoform X2 n=1 Tax=Ciona intestinalis TaxID=7719 RepID=UPI000EF50FE4|nr:apolipoprotein(a)-like isoform X2 [Ciona intestinalis]|eukprot:XP_026691063.1 apolipoprotein(a)-like isoform X2 [Ciona intestinalis]